jgi:hypothetical protein
MRFGKRGRKREKRAHLNILQVVLHVCSEVGVTELPRVLTVRTRTLLLRVFHFVEVVLVQLANEGGEVRVLEVVREDASRELVHVLQANGT